MTAEVIKFPGCGYYTRPRIDEDVAVDLFGNEFSERLCRRGAFDWLCENAAWAPCDILIDGHNISLEKGEVAGSFRFLSRAWRWGDNGHGRVQRWLRLLQQRGIITLRTVAGQTVVMLRHLAETATSDRVRSAKASPSEIADRDHGSSQRRIQETTPDSKKDLGDLGRSAPSEDDKAYVAGKVREITAALTGRAPKRTAELVDEEAYRAAVKKARDDHWLCNLAKWAATRFDGAQRMEAWEAIDARQQAGSRKATLPHIRKLVDRLDKLWRQETAQRLAA